jgi:hypothetical protein
MSSIAKGEEIGCPKGTVCGSVAEDVPDATTITPQVLRIKMPPANVAGVTGHVCTCCGERITDYRDERYKIRTASGWLGELQS